MGVVLPMLLVFVVFWAFGPPLPGPSLRELLGLPKGSGDKPCRREARLTRSPSVRAPVRGRWRREPSSPLARVEIAAAVSSGSAYLVGGQGKGGASLASVLRFDPRGGRYQRVARLPARVDHAGVAADRRNLYVVGGYVDSRPTDRVWRYSTRSRRWSELASLPTARGGLGAAVIGGRLYAAGGAPSTYPDYYAKPYGTLEVLDLHSGRWTAGPDMPTARHHVAAAVLDDMLYMVGGRSPSDFALATVERFDPERGRWQRLPRLPQGVGGPAATTSGGRLVVTGGDDEEGLREGGGWVTPAAWSYQPGDSRWRRLPDLSVPRHGHAAAPLGGRVYVFEGAACPGYGRQRSAESLEIR
jgi:hypothetical protein